MTSQAARADAAATRDLLAARTIEKAAPTAAKPCTATDVVPDLVLLNSSTVWTGARLPGLRTHPQTWHLEWLPLNLAFLLGTLNPHSPVSTARLPTAQHFRIRTDQRSRLATRWESTPWRSAPVLRTGITHLSLLKAPIHHQSFLHEDLLSPERLRFPP